MHNIYILLKDIEKMSQLNQLNQIIKFKNSLLFNQILLIMSRLLFNKSEEWIELIQVKKKLQIIYLDNFPDKNPKVINLYHHFVWFQKEVLKIC